MKPRDHFFNQQTFITATKKVAGGLVTKSCLTLATPWIITCGLLCPFLSPVDLPDLGIEPRSPALQVDSLSTEVV